MKKNIIFVILSCLLIPDTKPLAIRPFIDNPEEISYQRGTFLIIIGNEGGASYLESGYGLQYLKFFTKIMAVIII